MMTTLSKSPRSSTDMLTWQYQTLLAEIQQVQLHSESSDCPCNLKQLEPPEFCLAKHCLNIHSLASETAGMDKPNEQLLWELAESAIEQHEAVKNFICHKSELPDLVPWARGWRKKIEPIYYSCGLKGKMHQLMPIGICRMAQHPQVKITGTCSKTDCSVKVKAIESVEMFQHADDDIKAKIADLYDYATKEKALKSKTLTYHTVGDNEAQIIKNLTGIDVTGYSHAIDAHTLRHIHKAHGDEDRESQCGQVAITKQDVLLIPDVVLAPDIVEYGSKTRRGRDAIRYIKRMNGMIFVVEEVRTVQKTLALVTMYKKRSGRPDAPFHQGMSPAQTSETVPNPGAGAPNESPLKRRPPAQTSETFPSPGGESICPQKQEVKRFCAAGSREEVCYV